MKSKFKYRFETKYLHIKDIPKTRFQAMSESPDFKGQLLEVEVAQDNTSKGGSLVKGWLYLTLNGTPEKVNEFASYIASCLESHIRYFYGNFKINYGLVTAEYIPENEEELKQVNDTNNHWATLNFEGVPSVRQFEHDVIKAFPLSLKIQRKLQQINAAADANNLVDKYLGFFKIIETTYFEGNKKARENLNSSEEFKRLVMLNLKQKDSEGKYRPMTDNDIDEFVNKLIFLRDNCAHLKEKNSFGFAPNDSTVFKELKPYCQTIEYIARLIVMKTYENQHPKLKTVMSEY